MQIGLDGKTEFVVLNSDDIDLDLIYDALQKQNGNEGAINNEADTSAVLTVVSNNNTRASYKVTSDPSPENVEPL